MSGLELNLVDLPVNQGRAAAANAGVAQARGDYVTFLDDDDLVEADHLETLARAATAPGVRVVYSDAAVSVLELAPDAGDEGWTETERRPALQPRFRRRSAASGQLSALQHPAGGNGNSSSTLRSPRHRSV